jgi:cephalosporin hydroxylase
MQQRAELGQLLGMLRTIPLDVVVEIGSARGGTMYAWCRASSPSALLVSIDLPGGEFGGGYDEAGMATMLAYARANQRVHFLRGDSHAPETLEQLRSILAGQPISFLMIDGDHTYSGVKSDFEKYAPLVRSGGLIAFHDIVPGPPELVGGVPDFWREVRDRFEHRELVENREHGGYGLGVIRMP